MVDIRRLNDLVIPDAYLLPLQSEIITSIQGCPHLAILDAASFFYQWLLHPDYRYMFTIITHRGQETFQVPIIGYINSVPNVQCQIDNILHPICDWTRPYVDDIICGARSMEELVARLCELFQICLHYNISIKPPKFFLNYPDVGLLGQQVNSFGPTTIEEKFCAIQLLRYPETLGVLEYYLGLTGYLGSYIHLYAQLAEPFQALKTQLLKDAPLAGQQRRSYVSKTKLGPPSPKELAEFHSLHDALSKPTTLIRHDPDRNLWIDLDALKEFGFGAMAFHTKTTTDLPPGAWLSKTDVQPIIFSSCLLTSAERNYWPTELEIAGFV